MAVDDGDGDGIVQSARALMARLRGQPAADVRRFQGDPKLTGLGGRSGNWPWVAAAASEDLEWTVAALAQERETGLGNAEGGAIGYSAYAITGKLRLLQLARQKGHPVAAELASNLRATFALSSLAAGPVAAVTLLKRLHDGEEKVTGNARWRTGLVVCLPAPRQNFDFLNDLLSGLVAWAMQPSPTWRRKFVDGDPTAADLWPIEAVERIMGVPYGSPTDAAAWGLTEPLRAAFNTWTLAGWQPLIEAVDTWQTMAEVRIIRTDSGVAAGIEGNGLSTFKPTALVKSSTNDGRAELTMPARWSKGASAVGHCTLGAMGWIATADGVTLTHPLPTGAMIYKLAIGPSGPIRVLDASGSGADTPAVSVPSPAATVPAPPAPALGTPTPPTQLTNIMVRLASLSLSRDNNEVRKSLLRSLAGQPSADTIRSAADAVAAFGINPDSSGGKERQAIVEALRQIAATRS